MSRAFALVFLAFQVFYLVSCCPRRRPSPKPCSWRTCNHAWNNPYQPRVTQGRCIGQSRGSNHIYSTHHSTQPCPGSQSCDWRTQSRTRCSCRHVYNCRLNGWSQWSGHVGNNACARQTRSRGWSQSVTYTERDSNCNGIPSSCGNSETDYRTYCSCRYAYHCRMNSWSSWLGHVSNGRCARQSRYRGWSEYTTYTGRKDNCHGLRTSCGRKEYDSRNYCKCEYAKCDALPWTSWTDITPHASHCRTQERRLVYRKTTVYKNQLNNCNGVGPKSCPATVVSTREQAVYCAPLPRPSLGKWNNDDCSSKRLPCKTHCTFECSGLRGYRRVGNQPTRICQKDGTYSSSDAHCQDIEAPKITCPAHITHGNDRGKSYKTLTLPDVVSSDNSGKKPQVTAKIKDLGSKSQYVLPISTSAYEIVFTARDDAGLTDECTWYVTITDSERPKVLRCPDNIKQIINAGDSSRVVWDDPTFQDNFDKYPVITSDYSSGSMFPFGTQKVTFEATDKHKNVAVCSFDVTVSPHECPVFPPPRRGAQSCNTKVNDKYGHHLYCTTACQSGYDYISNTVFDYYQCGGGQWMGFNEKTMVMFPFPKETRPWVDCIEKDYAEGMKKAINAYVGKCNENDPDSLLVIKQNFVATLKDTFITNMVFCKTHASHCEITNVKVYCGKSKRSGDTSYQVISVEIVLRDTTTIKDKAKALKNHEMMKMDLDATEIVATKKIVEKMAIKGMHIEGYKSQLACKDGEIVHVDQGDGDELERSTCVKCAEGTYYDKGEEECIPCAEGTYQDVEGKLACMKCPEGTWTIGAQAGNRTECIDICEPGEYSQHGNGLATCLACPLGTYQPDFRQSNCIKCPDGTTTKQLGETSRDDCK